MGALRRFVCPKHGEWVPDGTLLGCPECAAEALAKERVERASRGY